MTHNLKIAIAENSTIVRVGLENMLKRLPGFHIQIVDISTGDMLLEAIRMHHPDILIINPQLPGFTGDLQKLKDDSGCHSMKAIALLFSIVPDAVLRLYDEQFSLFSDSEEMKQKLERMLASEAPADETAEEDEQQTLSAREKEIVVCVVKGMTNREIADRLFLSTHTVITHRRNIARKLQIHTPSGLTIYAIVNKLVELKDIQ